MARDLLVNRKRHSRALVKRNRRNRWNKKTQKLVKKARKLLKKARKFLKKCFSDSNNLNFNTVASCSLHIEHNRVPPTPPRASPLPPSYSLATELRPPSVEPERRSPTPPSNQPRSPPSPQPLSSPSNFTNENHPPPSPDSSTSSIEFLEEIPVPPPLPLLNNNLSYEDLVRNFPQCLESLPPNTFTVGPYEIDLDRLRRHISNSRPSDSIPTYIPFYSYPFLVPVRIFHGLFPRSSITIREIL